MFLEEMLHAILVNVQIVLFTPRRLKMDHSTDYSGIWSHDKQETLMFQAGSPLSWRLCWGKLRWADLATSEAELADRADSWVHNPPPGSVLSYSDSAGDRATSCCSADMFPAASGDPITPARQEESSSVASLKKSVEDGPAATLTCCEKHQ